MRGYNLHDYCKIVVVYHYEFLECMEIIFIKSMRSRKRICRLLRASTIYREHMHKIDI
jgi:hypothetical protein